MLVAKTNMSETPVQTQEVLDAGTYYPASNIIIALYAKPPNTSFTQPHLLLPSKFRIKSLELKYRVISNLFFKIFQLQTSFGPYIAHPSPSRSSPNPTPPLNVQFLLSLLCMPQTHICTRQWQRLFLLLSQRFSSTRLQEFNSLFCLYGRKRR